jgi:hypothetical protein
LIQYYNLFLLTTFSKENPRWACYLYEDKELSETFIT